MSRRFKQETPAMGTGFWRLNLHQGQSFICVKYCQYDSWMTILLPAREVHTVAHETLFSRNSCLNPGYAVVG